MKLKYVGKATAGVEVVLPDGPTLVSPDETIETDAKTAAGLVASGAFRKVAAKTAEGDEK